MRRILATAILMITPALSGCASTITAMTSRAFAAHDLETRMVSMTADRRLAFFIHDQEKPVYCMEALPDVATAFTSGSKPNVALPQSFTVGTDDAFSTSLTKTYDRANETQFYRLASFDNCMLYAMGAIERGEYATRMKALTEAATWYIGRTPLRKEDPSKPTEAKKPNEIELLVEIRDLLKKKP